MNPSGGSSTTGVEDPLPLPWTGGQGMGGEEGRGRLLKLELHLALLLLSPVCLIDVLGPSVASPLVDALDKTKELLLVLHARHTVLAIVLTK